MKVGLVVPFTSYDSHAAYDALSATKLALKERNENGGVRGYRVELVASDDEDDAAVAPRRARALSMDGDILGVIGHLSDGPALGAAVEYRQAGMPLLSFAPASALTDGGDRAVLRLGPNDRQVARAIIDSLSGKVGLSRVAVLQDRRLAASGLADAFERELSGRGGSVILRDSIDPFSSSFGAIVARLRDRRVELVVFKGDYRQAVAFFAELRRASDQTEFVAVGADTPDFLKVGGESLRGAMYVAPGPMLNRESDAGKRFFDKFVAAAGVEPLRYAPTTYDAVNMLLAAIERGVQDNGRPGRKAVAGALARIAKFVGVGGTLAFDEKGDLTSSAGTVYRSDGTGGYPGVAVR
ncbi:MAG: branched-chain amino acid ABC transporter substrate-binding protein [Chloroflexi bacterium]|nr:branched-chain amino acid ABC transporter substrate-binding protein [Chloroflexota bacterium]